MAGKSMRTRLPKSLSVECLPQISWPMCLCPGGQSRQILADGVSTGKPVCTLSQSHCHGGGEDPAETPERSYLERQCFSIWPAGTLRSTHTARVAGSGWAGNNWVPALDRLEKEINCKGKPVGQMDCVLQQAQNREILKEWLGGSQSIWPPEPFTQINVFQRNISWHLPHLWCPHLGCSSSAVYSWKAYTKGANERFFKGKSRKSLCTGSNKQRAKT